MPPKKKKSGKKKKEKDGELTVEDRYKKTMEEIEALKDHLAIRKELARRAQATSADFRDRMASAEDSLREQHDTQRAVSADMTRQYKTMQTEMGLRIHQLETELQRTRAQLDHTEGELKETRKDKEKMEREKDEEIDKLNAKITSMGTKYEIIINEAMNSLQDLVTESKESWEQQGTLIHSKNKQLLLAFGLNPLHL